MSAPIHVGPMASNDTFGSRLAARLPGVKIVVTTDAIRDETRIKATLKLRSYAPVATDEELEQNYMVDTRVMQYTSPEQLSEMYANMIRARMLEAVNDKMKPNPEIQALMNVAGFRCRYNSEHGFFQVWRSDDGKDTPSPRTDIDQEASVEEWRRLLTELVDIHRLEKEHPGLRVMGKTAYNDRSAKRASVARESQESISGLRAPGPIRYKPVMEPDPRDQYTARMMHEDAQRRERAIHEMIERGFQPNEIARLIR